jgi:hypothetical protein
MGIQVRPTNFSPRTSSSEDRSGQKCAAAPPSATMSGWCARPWNPIGATSSSVGPFRGYAPTGMGVQWLGAALFRVQGPVIAELWVLGDLLALEGELKKNAASR